LALVVSKHGAQAIEFPELDQESLQKQIWRPSNQEIERINAHLQRGMITSEDIQAVKGGYFSMYALWSLTPYLTKELDDQLSKAWKETLEETTHWLWDRVMGKLIPVLKEHSESAILIPAGQLALLPLHAAWTQEQTNPPHRRYALDELNISYVPSAHALWRASLAGVERSAESLLVVNNPDGSLSNRDGSLSPIEAGVQAVLNMFEPSKQLHRKSATIEAVKTAMPEADVLYFFTHANAGWQEAEQARLKLADGYLTLRDIFSLDLKKARLAVLSACETGVPGLELIDEMIGLPAGMMQAGVPGVVGSLWSVRAISTVMLMARFYFLWREQGCLPKEALRQAQIWLRDSTRQQKNDFVKSVVIGKISELSTDGAISFFKYLSSAEPDEIDFSSPYYWAAFTYTGI
jgi:CHAT domain-containing protein